MIYSCFTDEEYQNFIKKKDILLYKNNLTNIKNFKSDEAYKELFRAIVEFCDGKNESPSFKNERAEATFEIIKSGLIENAKKYSIKCETNRENAKKGLEKKKDIKALTSKLANTMSINNKESELDKLYKEKGINSFMRNS